MSSGFLSVRGTSIVDSNGLQVKLLGAALGGWLNMENFITGFPATESKVRAAMCEVLGNDDYNFFFDRWLYHFFTEADAKFFASLGLNCIRVPFNHRHLEDDMNPRVLKEEGFKHLDRIVNLCADHGIYTILDMHTVPGGQNQDWHSDNPTTYAAFWDYKDHQDRTVWLWEQIAQRYKDCTWVAGYNPMNEPADPKGTRLASYYVRLEKAIRAIDPNHILWLDGNTYSMEWGGFDGILPNSVYSVHDYSSMGFPMGEQYTGTPEQNEKLEKQFIRKCEFQHKHQVPIWNGEFGPSYAGPDEPNADAINRGRYNLLQQQLTIYEKYDISWSIWLYKDIGIMGMVSTSPKSAWNRLIHPFVEKKNRYHLDSWNAENSPQVDAVIEPLVAWIDKISPTAKSTYPRHWRTKGHMERQVLNTFLASTFCEEFAELFRGKSRAELEELAESFNFTECIQRKELNGILSDCSRRVE